MSRRRKTVFFVGHEAYRTGAPLLLLNLVKWVFENLDYKIYILLLNGGPLVNEYRKYGKVIRYDRQKPFMGYIRNIELRLLLGREKPEFIYFNTVASLKLFHRFRPLFRPFKKVLHIHEMPFSISQLIGVKPDFKEFHKILVVNKAIKTFVETFINSKSEIFLTPEYIDIMQLVGEIPLKSLNQPKIVLGVGVTSWRKGFDFFLQTAAICKRVYPGEFHFVWVGPTEKGEQKKIEYDLSSLGLADDFTLVGESEEVKRYYQKADLFFLSSREDPFPLVMLEASFFKLPVLYFEHSGGAEEFIDFPDFQIPYGDCHTAAVRIKSILNSIGDYHEKLHTLKVKAEACDLELVIQTLVDFILAEN